MYLEKNVAQYSVSKLWKVYSAILSGQIDASQQKFRRRYGRVMALARTAACKRSALPLVLRRHDPEFGSLKSPVQ